MNLDRFGLAMDPATLINLAMMASFIPIVLIWVQVRKKGRHWAGAWLLTLAPLYQPMGEDGFLAVWYAIATPDIDPHAVRGLVEPHAAGHMLGAGVAAIVLGILCAWIARRPLVRGEPWAWKALLFVGIAVVGVGLIELLFFFGHGLPTGGDHGAFGWPFWVAGFLAWGVGLWLARPERQVVTTTDGP